MRARATPLPLALAKEGVRVRTYLMLVSYFLVGLKSSDYLALGLYTVQEEGSAGSSNMCTN